MKLEVIETFKFADSKSIKNLKRKNPKLKAEGFYYEGDTFECDEKTANLLLNYNVVNVLEEKTTGPEEEKPKKKKATKSKKELTNK